MSKVVVGIGGGEIFGWSFKTKDNNQYLYQTEKIDKEIVKLANKDNPKLLFVGTASKENFVYFNAIKNIYEKLNCIVENLEILNKKLDLENLKEKILSYDIIYIGGGNTKFMLDEFKKNGVTEILKEAYDRNIIMAGFSAGCYLYHKFNYELIEGMNIIPAISQVHYEEKNQEKRDEFYKNVKEKKIPGIALENGTAIIYFENNSYKIIKSIKTAKAYKIEFINGKFLKEELEEDVTYNF